MTMPRYSKRDPHAICKYANREAGIRTVVRSLLARQWTFQQVRDKLAEHGVDVTVRTLYNWCAKWEREESGT